MRESKVATLTRILLAAATLTALLLLAAYVSSKAWLWLLCAAVIFLFVYARNGTYATLMLGALLVGAAVGSLLEMALRWQGAFLMSLGAAAITVEALEERPGNWAFAFGVAFVGIGTVVALASAGMRGYLAFVLLAALTAAVLALRHRH